MSFHRVPVIALLCTAAFAHAQAPPTVSTPPQPVPPRAGETLPAPPAVTPAGQARPTAVQTNVMGADGTTIRRPELARRGPVEIPTSGMGRYANGYLP